MQLVFTILCRRRHNNTVSEPIRQGISGGTYFRDAACFYYPRIYVNGDFLGIADDFDGFPQTAKLPPGRYNIKVVAPNGRIERRSIYVVAGEEINLNIKF